MVDDDTLERHVNRVEARESRHVPTIGRTEEDPLEERVEEMQAAARETHSELARRIKRVDDASADEAELDQLADRMEAIEARLADIEAELDD